MSTFEQLKQSLIAARKQRNTELITILSTIIAECAAIGKNGGNRLPTQAEVIAVIRKSLNNIELTRKVTNDVNFASFEYATLSEYLPQQLTEQQLVTIVQSLIDTYRLNNPANTPLVGFVMTEMKSMYPGRYDPRNVTNVLKTLS